MKNVFRTATVGMLSLPTIAALALPASASRVGSSETVSSGTHCQVTWENGALYLTDLGSTNGTVVAGTGTIPARVPVRLYPDSVFWIGEERCAFRVKMK